jgi:hypothetical protein
MHAADFATPLAAFAAGMATSVHCAVMCGPLGCALVGRKNATAVELRWAALGYHAARVVAYALIGAVLGSIGAAAGLAFHAPLSRALPWVLAVSFLMIAFGWDRKLPRIPFVSRWLFKLNLRGMSLRPAEAAVLLGAATPFLPCGPLYCAFGVALVSGAWLAGAALMTSFALGTIPLYALAQVGAWHFQARLTPNAQVWTRRLLGVGSALLIGGRAFFHDGSLAAPLRCLLCH